jgi:hypothetical protein
MLRQSYSGFKKLQPMVTGKINMAHIFEHSSVATMAIGNTLINSSDRNVGMEVCLKT